MNRETGSENGFRAKDRLDCRQRQTDRRRGKGLRKADMRYERKSHGDTVTCMPGRLSPSVITSAPQHRKTTAKHMVPLCACTMGYYGPAQQNKRTKINFQQTDPKRLRLQNKQ